MRSAGSRAAKLALHLRHGSIVIDEDSERRVKGWIKLGDEVAGRRPVVGKCDRCGTKRDLSPVGSEHLCATCYLEGQKAAAP